MYDITENYRFTATHRMPATRKRQQGNDIHLHRWSVSVTLRSKELPVASRPSEAAELDPLRHHIAYDLDGKYLNDIWPIAPTPARVAEHLVEWCKANLGGYARSVLESITVSIETSARSACAPWQLSSCRVRV
jgi:6-pyruvoyl-tetrahydropterin synthase